MALTFGGITYPLVAQADGAAVVSVADPFIAKALPFWQRCIATYIETAYAAVMKGQTIGLTNRACQTTLDIDPVPWLDTQIIKPPVLAIYPVKEGFARLTMERDTTVTDYKVAYVMPAVTFEKYKLLAPMLQAVFRLLVCVTEQQFDASYESGQRVWDAAGTMSVVFGEAQYGSLESADKIGHFLPAFFADVNVSLESAFNQTGATTMTDQEVTVDEGTDAGTGEGGLLEDAVEGFVSVG